MVILPNLSPLTAKLFRDWWRMKGQAVAIAMVLAAGVGMVVMSIGMMRSLERTRDSYYERNRLADIFAPATRAPANIASDLASLPGVARVEGRIVAGGTLDVAGIAEPVSALLQSLSPSGESGINQLVIREGRYPDPNRPGEVLASEQFMSAARLRPGDHVSAIIYGKQLDLLLVGSAISPQFVYTLGPGQIFPDNRHFGVVWMGEKPLAAALGLTDAFNQFVFLLDNDADEDEVLRRIDRLLAPYGGSGAYPRRDQLSDRFLSNELQQLRTMTGILPPIFLGVAALLINMVLSRMIDSEREEIGLLMAFGYRGGTIMVHYVSLAIVLAIPGLVSGLALGSWLGHGLASIYQDFFVFPFLEFRTDADVFLLASIATLFVTLTGTVGAVLRVRRMTPTTAMRPPLPSRMTGFIAAAVTRTSGLDEPTRMILRGAARRPVRTLLGALGIGSAVALYIASASSFDNSARLISLLFDHSNRADLTVLFAEPRDERALFELARMPGVLRVEPMRSVPATIGSRASSRREAIDAPRPSGDLYRLVDIDGKVIEPPPKGVVIGHGIAADLGLRPGDRMSIDTSEGRRPILDLAVQRIVQSPIGNPLLMAPDTLSRAMMDPPLASGAYLAIDADQQDVIYHRLKSTPMVAGVALRQSAIRGMHETIRETMGIVTLFNSGFAVLIIFGVVYNNLRIALAEQSRDLASLRVLGYRRTEVSYILLGELSLTILAAIPIGLLLGRALTQWLTARMGGELFVLPFGLTPATMAVGVIIMFASATVSAMIVRRHLDRLDLVSTLKTWE